MQQFNLPVPSTYVGNSLALLTASINTVLSNHSGTAFPSTNLQVGMHCFRSDQGAKGRMYVLSGFTTDPTPLPIWTMTYDMNLTFTNKEYVDQQITSLTNTMNQNLAGVAYYAGLTGAAQLQGSDYSAAQGDAGLAAGVHNIVVTSGSDTRLTLVSTMPRGNVRAVQDEFKPDGTRRWRASNGSVWSAWETPITMVNGACVDYPSFYAGAVNGNAFRVREVGLAGTSNGSAWGYSPSIDFFWSGYIQTLFGIDSTGELMAQRVGVDASPVRLITAANLHTVQKISNKTDSYGLVASDLSGGYIRLNSATAVNLVVYTNAAQPMPIGTVITLRQVGAGQVTVVASSGVTIYSPETLKLRKAGSTAMLIKISADVWELSGDLELL